MRIFKNGKNTSLNACVGKNGWPGTSYYANGFDEATHTLCQSVIARGVDPDEIIYPIVFCARHRIELFLKIQIKSIERIKGDITVSDPKLIKTHNLYRLWTMYKDAANSCDPRFHNIISILEPSILEFSAVDSTGETFRYAYDNENRKHLEDTVSLINIETFYSALITLSEQIKKAEIICDVLIQEYKTGTFTKNASRDVIEKISLELPPQKTWREINFTELKQKIAKKYNLSQRALSEIITKIKSHNELSHNIGEELPINEISKEKILKFLKLRSQTNKEFSGNNWREALLSDRPVARELHTTLRNEYSTHEIAALLALAEISSKLRYSEDYQSSLKQFESETSNIIELAEYLEGKSLIAQRIIDGLKKLRQETILKYISTAGIDVGNFPWRNR
jgi:hypothetical protein